MATLMNEGDGVEDVPSYGVWVSAVSYPIGSAAKTQKLMLFHYKSYEGHKIAERDCPTKCTSGVFIFMFCELESSSIINGSSALKKLDNPSWALNLTYQCKLALPLLVLEKFKKHHKCTLCHLI